MIKELETLIPHAALLTQAKGQRWFALTGDRIELEDTGIYIQLTNHSNYPPFVIIDGLGRKLAYASDLPMLKQVAEEHARHLKEFNP